MTNREYSAKRYREFKAAGMCPACGNPVDSDHVLCEKCREYMRKKFQEKLRANRDAGLCVCGAETDGIHKMCEKCRERRRIPSKRDMGKSKNYVTNSKKPANPAPK